MAEVRLDRSGYELELDEVFGGPELSRTWIPHYLPQWSSREQSAARYGVGPGGLRLRVDADQPPWNPEADGWLRVSSLQTGVFSGRVGSGVGQHRFRPDLVVRESQPADWRYTPRFGLIEVRLRALADPSNMVALWMIGIEDEPEHSAEVCICEIFGRDVGPSSARVGMGVHPFGDRSIRDDFEQVALPIDARDAHGYAAEWTPGRVAFYVDEQLVKVVDQSPDYPMQLMLSLYEFATGPEPASPLDRYPKEAVVERLRGWRPVGDSRRSSHLIG